MNRELLGSPSTILRLLRNWVSMAGIVTVLASLLAYFLLFLFEWPKPRPSPYTGLLTFLVAPVFTCLGAVLVVVGVLVGRRRERLGWTSSVWVIDFSRSRDRRALWVFALASVLLLMGTAVGSYHSYQFTESTSFCGQECHPVMKPEMVTYQRSAHAHVPCVECHVGSGATSYVRSKLAGLREVYANVTDHFPRPLPAPLQHLRPSREMCEQCHWPPSFTGNRVRTYTHFLSDEKNTEYSVRLLLRVGRADGRLVSGGGIHWHVGISNKVEYIATDALRQTIPWVRLTRPGGLITEYRTPGFEDPASRYPIRTMECLDCHNRPAHRFQKPNDAVDLAILLGDIDTSLPFIRSKATQLLTQDYASEDEALKHIEAGLTQAYGNPRRWLCTIEAVQGIYRQNFFPEMKANWRAYPENIGHKDWPGCSRCHDDKHKSDSDNRVIPFRNCNTCHLILSQGTREDLEQTNPDGMEFRHPGGDYDAEFKCSHCHTGGP